VTSRPVWNVRPQQQPRRGLMMIVTWPTRISRSITRAPERTPTTVPGPFAWP